MSSIDPTSYQKIPDDTDEAGWGDLMITAVWTKGTALIAGVGALRGLITAVQRFFVDPTDFGNPLAEIKFQEKYTIDDTGEKIINEATDTYKSITSVDNSVIVTNNGDSLDLAVLAGQKKLYNPSVTPIPSGTVLHLANAIDYLGVIYPVFEFAKADKFETCQGSLVFASENISPNSTGTFVFNSAFIDAKTSIVSGKKQLWLSDTVAGAFTDIEPTGQGFKISLGASLDSDINGSIWANITSTTADITNEAFIGAILETIDFTISSNGTVVTGLLVNKDEPTRDLTMVLPALRTLDIPESTGVLTVSTVGFPTNQNHCRIDDCLVQSALNVKAVGGARANQNWNDHLKKKNGNGHMLHAFQWIREQPATYKSGAEATFDATAGNGYIAITAGVILQAHPQNSDAISMPTRDVIIDNDPDTTNRETDNLNTISKFSDGSNWSNKWGKIVVYLVANKYDEPNFIHVNLPSAGFTNEGDALENDSKANYGIPSKYKSKAVLIGAFSIKVTGGTITYNGASTGYQDLRIGSFSGGSTGGGVTSLLALDDVSPSSFIGQAGKSLTVAAGETTTEFQERVRYINNIADLDMGNYKIKIGNIEVFESTHRGDMLRITNPNNTGLGGIQVGNSGSKLWNFMGDSASCGVYNDANNQWTYRTFATGETYFYYLGNARLVTTATGINITGILASSGVMKANNTETVLTENIVDDIEMNGFYLKEVGSDEHADNAAAITAGLTVGDIYRTGDILKIVH